MPPNYYYILDEQHVPIPVEDGRVWSEWMVQHSKDQLLGHDIQGDISISTRYFGTRGCLWETVIFANVDEQRYALLKRLGRATLQWRYQDYEQAIQGHQDRVVEVGRYLSELDGGGKKE